ncbi:hypothetical protein SAMN02927923_04425 [Microvirga guangxiensis]|uniref:Uncharacterized protein n=2 Tax=Microvirga guangxiensis TaxID=549386 RepID=A0A1G5LK43_9HYPH|nr:hypothetical protein SAMN02927923_04425 [Microvirga guangxiensis]
MGIRFRIRRLSLLQTFSLLIFIQGAIAALDTFRVALARLNDACIQAPLGQAAGWIAILSCHGLAVAMKVAAVCPRVRSLLTLKSVLAAFNMARGTLLHLLLVVTRIADILMAELAFHDGLLFLNAVRPT